MKKIRRSGRGSKKTTQISFAQTLKLAKAAAYEKGQNDVQKKVNKLVKEFQKQLAVLLAQKPAGKKRGRRKSKISNPVTRGGTMKRRGRPKKS